MISIVQKSLRIAGIFYPKDLVTDDQLKRLNPDFVINFLCDRVHRGLILNYKNINFHPGTPEYPGRGGASYAIFDGKREYGATAHAMVEKVDQGAIFDTATFPMIEGERCDQLFDRAEDACRDLLKKSLEYLGSGHLPPVRNDLKWSRSAISRKEFQKWLILDPSNEVEFRKKIVASRHRLFPGPYVVIHGHKFALVSDVTYDNHSSI